MKMDCSPSFMAPPAETDAAFSAVPELPPAVERALQGRSLRKAYAVLETDEPAATKAG